MYHALPLACLLLFLTSTQGIKNTNVTRTIDLTTIVARITSDIYFDGHVSEYQFTVDPDFCDKLAFFSPSYGDVKLGYTTVPGKPCTYWIKPHGSSNHLTVVTVFTNVLEPKPKEILQSDKQFVKYSGNMVFYSPYVTDSQTNLIMFPKGDVLSVTDSVSLKYIKGNHIHYGPFPKKLSFSTETLLLHFEHPAPMLVVTDLTRLIEVSNWGNIAVEETLEIQNLGAKLKGPFSRLDFDYGIGQQLAVNTLITALPAAAKDIYYRDEIGNISTSTVSKRLDSIEVHVSPRFPLMGGWKTRYTLGYNVPVYEYLYRKGHNFALVMRFVDHIYDGQFVRNLTLKIILPEMVSDLKFDSPIDVYEKYTETFKTYLDTTGRTVLVAKAGNLVDEHIKDFTLRYTFHLPFILREPLMLVAAFACIFLAIIIYVRLDFSIYKDEKNEIRQRVQALVDETQSLLKQRSSIYQACEDLLQNYKLSKNSAHFTSERKKMDNNHKNVTQKLTDIQGKMSDLYVDGVEKLNELHGFDQRYRALISESTQLAEKLLSGKLNKSQYQTANDELNAKKTDLIHHMDSLAECL